MSKLSGGSKGAIAGVAGVVIIGAVAWFGVDRDPAPVPTLEATQDTAPQQAALPTDTSAQTEVMTPEVDTSPDTPAETDEVKQAEPTPAPAPEVTDAPAKPPTFDEVRQEADGMTVIAGRAAPGSTVQVLQDGQEITSATADNAGKFAAIALIAPDGKGHVLSLVQTEGETSLVSADQIILAPIAPVQMAEATVPESDPVTEEVPAEPQPTEAETSNAPPEVAQEPEPTETAQAEPAQDPVNQDQAKDPANPAPEQQAEVAPQVIDAPIAEAKAEALAQPAAQEVAVLRTTDQGVELLNTPRPEAMENVALDTISYSEAGDVQLAGRAQVDTRSVRVYLDNNAIISLPVDDAGRWRGDLPDVDEGIYTLRVDEVAEGGAVTSRVETPFKREDPEVLAQVAAKADGPIKQITVQKGATLWAIAEERYGDGLLYVNVFKANGANIRDPDLIYPGQIFDLPE